MTTPAPAPVQAKPAAPVPFTPSKREAAAMVAELNRYRHG